MHDSIKICRNKYGDVWDKFYELGAKNLDLESYCDYTKPNGFGVIYDKTRKRINDFYRCDKTDGSKYCSDY